MEQSNEIARLLEEIRGLQRAHLDEYRSMSQQFMEINKAATKDNANQYKKGVEVWTGDDMGNDRFNRP